MNLRPAALPKSPLSCRRFIRRARARFAAPALALAAGALLFTNPLARAADTEDDVLAGATDLGVNTAGTTYTTTAGTTSDVTFAAGTIYANAGSLLLSAPLSIGSLDDLNATAITINGSALLTLNVTTGGNVVAPAGTNGGNSADSLFVASGGSLTINDTAGISVANTSSFDAIGTLNLGTTGVSIVAGKVLSFTGAGTTTLNGVIAATTGAVTINDAGGSVTLGGANLYTGATTLTAGTLRLTNTLALQSSTLTTGAGSLVFDSTVASNAFTFGGLAGANNLSLLNNGTTPAAIALTVGGNNATTTYSGILSGTGASLTKTGTGVLTLSGANTYTGGTTLTLGGLYAQNGAATNVDLALGTGGVNLNGGTLYLKANGSGSTQTIITGDGTTGNNVTVGGNATIDVNQSAVAGANTGNTFVLNNLSIGANTLTVTGGNTYALRFAGTTTLTGNATFSPGTANLTLAGNIGDGGAGFGFTKTGAGTLTLLGTNSYTGTTTISAGTLSARGTGALSSGSTVNLGAATLQVLNDGAGSNGTISLGNNVTLTATGATINVGNNGSANTGNTVAFGALTSSAGGFQTNFTGANGYLESFTSLALTGTAGGTTTLNPTTTSVTILGNVTNPIANNPPTGNYDTLTLGGTSTGNAINGVISDNSHYVSVGNGDTRVTMSGTGSWTLAGANTYHGPTAVSAGTLNLTGSLGNGSGPGNGVIGSTAVTTSGAGVFSEGTTGAIAGTSTFAQGSTGTSVLAGTNTYTGATTVSAGTLSLTGSLGSTNITTSGTGVFTEGTTGSIGGNASFTQNSSGLSIFSGSNTYTGATTVSAGILEFANTGAQPTGLTTVGAGGTLALVVGGAGGFTTANVNQYYANTLPRVNTVSRSLGIDTTAGDASLGGFNVPAATSVSLNKLGTNTLNLGAITRAAGGTANFTVTNGTLTTTTQNTGGSILGGYATFGGNTWAVSAGDGTNPAAITGLAAGSYTPSVAATTAPGSTADVDFQASNTTAYTGQTINSLRFNTAAATTLTLSGTNIITTGGILNTSTVGNLASLITGGTLEGSAGGELIVTNNDTSSNITIASVIANNGTATGLTKSGLGLLQLNSANTYTGVTAIDSGTLQLGNSFGGKILNTSGVVIAAGATLTFSGGNSGGNESNLVGGVISGAGGVADSQGNGNISVNLDKANTYTGPTTITTRATLTSNVAPVFDANGNVISSGFGVNSPVVFTGGGANFGVTLLLSSTTQVGSLSTNGQTVANVIGNGVVLNNNNLTIGGDNTNTTFNAQISGGAIPNSATNSTRNIGGSLTKIGTGTQTLGGANLYSGSTTIAGGTLSVTTIANGGFATTGTAAGGTTTLTLANGAGAVAGQNIQGSNLGIGSEVISSVNGNVVTLNGNANAATNTPIAFGTANGLGISTNVASNLVLNGGTLQYTGAAASTDRLFTVGAATAGATGTLDASGTGALNFTNTGAIAYGTVDQTRTLNLTGTNTGANTLAPVIGDNGAGAVSLNKNGVGSWTLTGANTYSGTTSVNAGTLLVNGSTGSAMTPSGATTVATGATLGGTGILTVTSVTANGTLAPGATLGATTGALTLNTTTGTTINGTLLIGITAGGSSTLNTTGGLTLGPASTLTVTGTSGAADYDLANYTGTLTGTFGTVSIPTGYALEYNGTDFGGTAIEIVSVPEPSTWVGGAFVVGALAWQYRRRSRRLVS